MLKTSVMLRQYAENTHVGSLCTYVTLKSCGILLSNYHFYWSTLCPSMVSLASLSDLKQMSLFEKAINTSRCNQSDILWHNMFLVLFYFFILTENICFPLLLEREKGKDREREKKIHTREKHQLVAFCTCSKWGPNP